MKNEKTNFRFNIIALKSVKRLMQSHFFPYLLQCLALIVFLILVINGIASGVPELLDKKFTVALKKTNLTTLFVWGLWWPCLIIITILFNRVWCTICPMELVSNVANRIKNSFGFRGAPLPRWVQQGYLVLVLYLVMQFLVNGFQVHRVPFYSSLVFLGLMAIALLAGFAFYEPRAFCKGFCPASLLLNAYNRFTPLMLKKNQSDICAQCTSRDCVSQTNRDKRDARSCPHYLRPYNVSQNDGCILCFQCAKVCPYHNIGFGIVRGESREKVPQSLSFATVLFVLMASGFVSHELFTETAALEPFFHAVPRWMLDLTGMTALFPWIEALCFLILYPLLACIVLLTVAYVLKKKIHVKELMPALALPLLPIVAAGHMVKALLKLNQWIVYLPQALSEPTGITTATSIMNGTRSDLQAFLPGTCMVPLFVVTFLAALYVSIKIIRSMANTAFALPSAYAGVTLFISLYCFVALNADSLFPKEVHTTQHPVFNNREMVKSVQEITISATRRGIPVQTVALAGAEHEWPFIEFRMETECFFYERQRGMPDNFRVSINPPKKRLDIMTNIDKWSQHKRINFVHSMDEDLATHGMHCLHNNAAGTEALTEYESGRGKPLTDGTD